MRGQHSPDELSSYSVVPAVVLHNTGSALSPRTDEPSCAISETFGVHTYVCMYSTLFRPDSEITRGWMGHSGQSKKKSWPDAYPTYVIPIQGHRNRAAASETGSPKIIGLRGMAIFLGKG